jgi:uncharacterized cupin superfamily protein
VNRVHVPDLPWAEQHSPSQKFSSSFRNLSLALGGVRNAGTWGGGHPFDLQIRRVPPGASVCPFHLHLAQWEMFVVLAGNGTVRTTEARTEIKTGDVFFHPPGTPHQLTNTGAVELEVLILTDNPLLDGCYYPDSDKWALRPPMKVFRMSEADYFDGEDAAAAKPGDYQPAPTPPPPPAAPFAQRKLHPDALAWEEFVSPQKKFRGWSKELSIALGAKRNTPTGLGGHPFDLELQKLAPGETGCPFHSHAAQWELYYLLSGTASVRANQETHTLRAGDVVLHPPGEAHQIRNASATDDLLFYLVADNPPVDYWHYPDSGKWGLREPRKFFRLAELDYYDGEE